jgi:FkbM family methyltransferase
MIEDIIRKIVHEEIDTNNLPIKSIFEMKDVHKPFAVYMGEGEILTRSFYDIMYLVSSYDCTMTPHFIIHGVYESELTKYFINNMQENSVFVDVGANFGYYSCIAAKKIKAGKGGKVHSFEANRNAFLLLQKNIVLNWIDTNAVSLNLVALSHTEEDVLFKNYKYRFGGSQFFTSEESTDPMNEMEVVKLRTRTLDSFLDNQPAVDFLKIDVEGAEFKVLRGASKTIGKNVNIKILLEWNNGQFRGHGTNPADLVNFLRDRSLCPFKLNWEDGSTAETSFDYLLNTDEHLCGVLFTK